MKRSEILLGKDYRKTVEIEGLGEVEIRPLTDGEYSMIQEKQMEFIKLPEKLDVMNVPPDKMGAEIMKQINFKEMDISVLTHIQKQAIYLTVSSGMVLNEEIRKISDTESLTAEYHLTVEEVGKMPIGIPEKIASEIMKLTEARAEELNNFRPKS